jgi:hypothetical protein
MAEILRWCGVTASHYREKTPKRKARPISTRFPDRLAVIIVKRFHRHRYHSRTNLELSLCAVLMTFGTVVAYQNTMTAIMRKISLTGNPFKSTPPMKILVMSFALGKTTIFRRGAAIYPAFIFAGYGDLMTSLHTRLCA